MSESTQFLSIYEVASILGTSHTTIYKKIKNSDVYKRLEPFIKVYNGNKSISIEGVEILKQYIQTAPTVKENADTTENLKETLINILQQQIADLKDQLVIKDKQLESQSELHRNTQLLLSQSQQKILYLEQSMKKQPWWKMIF